MSKIYVTGIGPGLYEHMTEGPKPAWQMLILLLATKPILILLPI